MVLNQKDKHVLAELVVLGGHVVGRVREHSGLEDGGQVGGGHAVEVGLGGKDGQEVEDVEQQLSVERR